VGDRWLGHVAAYGQMHDRRHAGAPLVSPLMRDMLAIVALTFGVWGLAALLFNLMLVLL
jgi:hypothetical protein